MELINELLEAAMVISFGLSWPLSIIKSWNARTAKGKSLPFLCLIFFGYICGVVWKMLVLNQTGEFKWPTFFYFLNLIMVGTDIVIYFRNKKLDEKSEK